MMSSVKFNALTLKEKLIIIGNNTIKEEQRSIDIVYTSIQEQVLRIEEFVNSNKHYLIKD